MSEIVDDGILALRSLVFEDQYEITEFLGSGNSGEVYRLKHPRLGDNRVMKLFVPFYELRQARIGEHERGDLTQSIIKNAKNQPYQKREYNFLSRIDHPFIVKVHDYNFHDLTPPQKARLGHITGESITERVSLPFIIAMYVKRCALKEGLRRLSRTDILKVLGSLAEAIDYIHLKHNLLHLDIKSNNVWVRDDGYPILLDFVLSQDLSDDALAANEKVRGGIDWNLTPFRQGTSGIAEFVQRVQTDGISRQEFRDEGFPGLDLYQTGLMLRDCREEISARLTHAETQYLQLVIDQLRNWETAKRLHPGALRDLFRKIDATQIYLAVRPGMIHAEKAVSLSADRKVFVSQKLAPYC